MLKKLLFVLNWFYKEREQNAGYRAENLAMDKPKFIAKTQFYFVPVSNTFGL